MVKKIGLSSLFWFVFMGAALACSCGDLSNWGFLSAEGAFPLNAKGVMWHQKLLMPHLLEPLPVKARDDAGNDIPLTFERFRPTGGGEVLLLSPQGGFQPNTAYTFTSHTMESTVTKELNIQTPSEILRPVSAPLRLVAAKPQQTLFHPQGGTCSVIRGRSPYQLVESDVEMVLPPQFLTFKDQFIYTTYVDGELYYSPRWIICRDPKPGEASGRLKTKNTLMAGCFKGISYFGVASGVHRVRMVAELPGTDFKLTSEEKTLDFSCPAGS